MMHNATTSSSARDRNSSYPRVGDRANQDEDPPIVRNWTYPRGKDLIADERRREEFFTKNEVFFWKTLLDLFDGKHELLSTDVIAQVKNKWKNLYAAYKRNKEKESPAYQLINLDLEDMDLDDLFLKLEEIEDRDDMEIYEPDFTKSGLPEGETLPVIEICHEGIKTASLEMREKTRQQFIDILHERNEAVQKKKNEKY